MSISTSGSTQFYVMFRPVLLMFGLLHRPMCFWVYFIVIISAWMSVYVCPIRVRAEICVLQIRVSLPHSVSDSTLRTDREWRRNSTPFASSSECRMMYPPTVVAFMSESNCAWLCEILAPPHIFREKMARRLPYRLQV